MVLKRYIKFNNAPLSRSRESNGFEYLIYLLSSVLLTLGVAILTIQYLSPLLSFASRSSYLRPVSATYLSALSATQHQFSFRELQLQKIFSSSPHKTPVPSFFINIPALSIQNARVETNSVSLKPDLSLGHLSGSSLPGEKGLMVIYGHSSSPLLYKKEDYQTIFSTLDQLNKGDLIKVTYNKEIFTYQVRLLEVITPADLDLGLSSPTRGSLALITCYPFGQVDKRLIVYADLSY